VLLEGVTPTGKALTKTDYSATIKQFGDFIRITDVIQDTHEDPVLNESVDILSIQAAEMMDRVYAGVLTAGASVLRANGLVRTDINTVITDDLIRTACRNLDGAFAKLMQEMIEGGIKINTTPISAAYIGVCHSDVRPDLERLSTWIPIERYANVKGVIPGEMGAAGRIRFVMDNMVKPFADSGGAAASTYISTSGSMCDVYPILVFGQNAYGVVTLGGQNGAKTVIVNPGKGDSMDPLGQRGSVGWKHWGTACILNDLWMERIEVACKG
jgi:N4-gp56 family major capsid protein